MPEKTLSDKNGTKVGKIATDSQGNSVAYNRNGTKVGTYDSKRDITYNQNGTQIGRGDFLSSLIDGVSR